LETPKGDDDPVRATQNSDAAASAGQHIQQHNDLLTGNSYLW
jgi:hypothetical protein